MGKVELAEQLSGFTIVAAGLEPGPRAMVAQALPECQFLQSGLNSWQIVRFCKLVGPVIVIVEYESLILLQSEQIPAVEYQSTTHVLALCRDCNEEAYKTATSAGCSGLLALDAVAEHAKKAVKAISEGVLWYPRAVLSALARQSILDRSISQKRLTDREREVLRLLGLDCKNQAIADQLFISRNTVRWHLRTLYTKIGVANRAEARQYARKHAEEIHSDAGVG
jgi:DNA-binding NarL/FixJ family response regulator